MSLFFSLLYRRRLGVQSGKLALIVRGANSRSICGPSSFCYIRANVPRLIYGPYATDSPQKEYLKSGRSPLSRSHPVSTITNNRTCKQHSTYLPPRGHRKPKWTGVCDAAAIIPATQHADTIIDNRTTRKRWRHRRRYGYCG